LALFPPDAKTKEGSPFWSGPKRCPSPIEFSVEDDIHFQFVHACANLIAFNLKIEQVRDEAKARALAAQTQALAYVQSKIVVETPEQQKEREEKKLPPPQAVSGEDDEEVLQKLMVELKGKITNNIQVEAIEFEKDDATNFHIDFIHATAQLRARNYQITECDFNKTKMIAGRIIPAIATTTAMITGCVAAEFYKFVQGWTDIEKFKNAFINLAVSIFLISEPDEIGRTKSKDYDPIMGGAVKAIPEGYTIYDKTLINAGSLTFQELFDFLKEKVGIDVSMVACGKVALYNAWLPS
jgi:ubiquitin-activating enzyme E1